MENLPTSVLYFPYILLITATLLLMVDRPFVLVLFNSLNMEELHRMLVVNDPHSKDFDRRQEARDLHLLLGASSGFFLSYLLRTLASLLASFLPILLFAWTWTDFTKGLLYCEVLW